MGRVPAAQFLASSDGDMPEDRRSDLRCLCSHYECEFVVQVVRADFIDHHFGENEAAVGADLGLNGAFEDAFAFVDPTRYVVSQEPRRFVHCVQSNLQTTVDEVRTKTTIHSAKIAC